MKFLNITVVSFYVLEVEKLWRKVWQLACHQDDILEVGNALVCEIASLSSIVVPIGEEGFAAYPNAGRHRRLLDGGTDRFPVSIPRLIVQTRWDAPRGFLSLGHSECYPRHPLAAGGQGRTAGQICFHQSGSGGRAARHVSE